MGPNHTVLSGLEDEGSQVFEGGMIRKHGNWHLTDFTFFFSQKLLPTTYLLQLEMSFLMSPQNI